MLKYTKKNCFFSIFDFFITIYYNSVFMCISPKGISSSRTYSASEDRGHPCLRV